MIIGITGFKRSGKDTFTKFLIDEVQLKGDKYPQPETLYFADKLKKSVAVLFKWKGNHFEWSDQFKETGQVKVRLHEDLPEIEISGREILQRYGTEAHREVFGDDFWIEQTLPLDIDDSQRVIMIPDLRFPNEAERIRVLGGIIVRVNRDMFGEEDRHASEQPLPNKLVDFEIDNNDDLDHLRSEASQFAYNNIFNGI